MFNFSADKNTGFNFSQQQRTPHVESAKKQQPQYKKAKNSDVNPFTIDDLFKFKKENILYNRVMQSAQMLGFLKAQKVAKQFVSFTEPEHKIGRRLNLQI